MSSPSNRHGHIATASVGVKDVSSCKGTFIFRHIPRNNLAIRHRCSLKARAINGATIPQLLQKILNVVVQNFVSLRCCGCCERAPSIGCAIRQPCKPTRVQQPPAPTDGNPRPRHMLDVILRHGAACGEPDINTRCIIKFSTRVLYQIVGDGVVLGQLRCRRGSRIDRSDATQSNPC